MVPFFGLSVNGCRPHFPNTPFTTPTHKNPHPSGADFCGRGGRNSASPRRMRGFVGPGSAGVKTFTPAALRSRALDEARGVDCCPFDSCLPVSTHKNRPRVWPVFVAGAAGIEPTTAVLETAVIPFNYAPMLAGRW